MAGRQQIALQLREKRSIYQVECDFLWRETGLIQQTRAFLLCDGSFFRYLGHYDNLKRQQSLRSWRACSSRRRKTIKKKKIKSFQASFLIVFVFRIDFNLCVGAQLHWILCIVTPWTVACQAPLMGFPR